MASSGFPRRFGSYVLLKPLARGGMGELDLAVTGGHGMEKLCVIKRVLSHLRVADNVQRFREEATVMMRLSHGNLVGVLDAGREDGQFYLAMDFVEGKDLLATWNQCATRRVAFPIEIAAYVIKELARGLDYAHAYRDLRLVHRDISPANVLLSYSGEIKLTDFGLAISKLKEQRTAPGIIYGKLAYLAPEQARGNALDGRVDIYAAGILLWEMLTGQQLFPSTVPGTASPGGAGDDDGGSTLDALERVRHPVVAPPSSVTGRVPAAMDAIVMRALEVDPRDRHQTGEELRADLAAFLAKFAPATDAATLASFMSLLFQEDIDKERADREALWEKASEMLSGPWGRPTERGTPAGPMSPPTASDDGGPRLVDPALWNSSPGGDNATPLRNATPAPADTNAATGLSEAAASSAFAAEDASVVATGIQRRRQEGDRRGRAAARAALNARPAAEPRNRPHQGHGTPDTPAPNRDGLAAVSAMFSPEMANANGARGGGAKNGAESGSSRVPFGEEDPRVGTTIAGRYFLRRLCGEGAMGRVYEGHHIEIGRRVAIKILHSNFHNTPDVVERFRREARAATRIGHPNIVDVTDSGTTPDGAFFFVMEYLDGVDLEQVLSREGPLAIERALLIAAQACRALAAAHAAGIIHRDLKPANVMLIRHRDQDDFVKVLDFGISKQSELDVDQRGKDVGLTRPDAAVGTPIYMAPEQVAGRPSDGRTDVYAVGELLFEMLTGTPPCSGGDIIAVFNKKANEDPAPVRSLRPDVPVSVEQLLTRAMARLPSDRHATMTELKDDLMNALSRLGDTPHAAPPPETKATTTLSLSSPLPLPAAAATATGRVWRAPTRAVWLACTGVVAGLGLASMAVLWRTDINGLPARAARTPPVAITSPATPHDEGPRPAGAARGGVPISGREAPPPSVGAPGRIFSSTESAPPAKVGVTASSPPPATSDGPGQAMRGDPPARASRVSAPHTKSRSRHRAPYGAFARPAPGAGPPAPSPSAEAGAPAAADDLLRGRAAFAKGDFPQALRLGRAAVAAGDTVGGHLLIGDAFYKLERFTDALSDYETVLKAAPTNPQARRGRELVLRRTGQ